MFFFVSVSGPLRPYRPAQENLVLLFLLQVSKWQMASVETHTHTSWALLTNYRSVYMKKFLGGSKETDGRATGTNCADVDPFSARLQYSRRGNRNFSHLWTLCISSSYLPELTSSFSPLHLQCPIFLAGHDH